MRTALQNHFSRLRGRRLTKFERNAIREARLARNASLQTVADEIGVTRQTLHGLLGGLTGREQTLYDVRAWLARQTPPTAPEAQ